MQELFASHLESLQRRGRTGVVATRSVQFFRKKFFRVLIAAILTSLSLDLLYFSSGFHVMMNYAKWMLVSLEIERNIWRMVLRRWSVCKLYEIWRERTVEMGLLKGLVMGIIKLDSYFWPVDFNPWSFLKENFESYLFCFYALARSVPFKLFEFFLWMVSEVLVLA